MRKLIRKLPGIWWPSIGKVIARTRAGPGATVIVNYLDHPVPAATCAEFRSGIDWGAT